MTELIRIERDGHVALVRFLRTGKHNAFNRALSDALIAALEELEADGDARAIVLTSSGRVFSAGADMTEAVAAIDGSGRREGMGAAIARAANFSKPLLACINGICYGGGALLAITCDIRIASDDAAFRFPGAAYGLVVGGSQLPRIVGPAYAKELLFTGGDVVPARHQFPGEVGSYESAGSGHHDFQSASRRPACPTICGSRSCSQVLLMVSTAAPSSAPHT